MPAAIDPTKEFAKFQLKQPSLALAQALQSLNEKMTNFEYALKTRFFSIFSANMVRHRKINYSTLFGVPDNLGSAFK